MSRPTRKIKCKVCKRKIDAIIAKQYGLINKHDPNETIYYQKVIVKDHKRSFWSREVCKNSGQKFRIIAGSSNTQTN